MEIFADICVYIYIHIYIYVCIHIKLQGWGYWQTGSPLHSKLKTWEGKRLLVTASPETWGRRVPGLSSTLLPTSPLPRWQPKSQVSLEAWPQDLHVTHRTYKPERCSSSSEGSCHVSWRNPIHPDSPPFLTSPPRPWLWPPPSLIFTSVSFIFKPTEGLVKLCFLSKMNLGARGWTSHRLGERSTECFTLDSRKDSEREDRGREVSPGGGRRRAIKHSSPWLDSRSGAPPSLFLLPHPFQIKNQTNHSEQQSRTKGALLSPAGDRNQDGVYFICKYFVF